MFSIRDIVWSVVICAALTGLFQCQPAWSARREAERDARKAFEEGYAGYRYLNGQVIAPAGVGVHDDPMLPRVMNRRLEITAEKINWTGSKVELVARHAIELSEPSASGKDPSQDVHVRLERRNGRWVYTLFEVRNGPVIEVASGDNPWLQAVRATQATEGEDEDEPHGEDDDEEADPG